jgi:hypothetical protein
MLYSVRLYRRVARAAANRPHAAIPENPTQLKSPNASACSQMHVSRLLAKVLGTLRSHVREPELAVTG